MPLTPLRAGARACSLLCALFALPTSNVLAQVRGAAAATDSGPQGTIVGTIVDSSTQRPIAGVEVRLLGATRRAVSDLGGKFQLRGVSPGRHQLEGRRLGYQFATRSVVVSDDGTSVHVRFALVAAPFRLAEVTVAPGSFSFLEAGPSTRQSISRAEIETAPFGEDLFRAMNRLPGLSSGDYGAHFSIRGGRHDETLILLDGLEIYEPYHLKDFNEGALSIIDVEAIDGVELLTGGFPAHYGDRRSGVMNISARTPREDGTHLSFGASLTNAHALAEGTFADRKGAWLVSGRRGFVDALLSLISKNETKAPTYQDAFATVRYKLRPNHTLALNALHASDRYKFTIKGTTGFADSIRTVEAANNSYGNSYAWLTLRSLFGQYLSARSLVSVGTVTARREGDEHHALIPLEYYGVKGTRDFTVVGLKQDYSFQRSERMVLDWGFDARSLRADFDWINRVTQNPDDPTPDTLGYYPRTTVRAKKTKGTTLGAYVSDRLQVAGPVTLELGLRYDGADYTGDRNWSPRLHTLVRLSDNSSLRAGWGVYRQRQMINDENAFDRLNRYFPSERSRQWTLGYERRDGANGSFRAELYHKSGDNLRPILRNWKGGLNVFPESAEDRILVYTDETTSRGLELYLDRSFGRRLTLRSGYSLAKVEERVSRIDNVNDRLRLVFDSTHAWPQDQRHALNLDLSYRTRGAWTITSAYTFHTGWPYTAELGVPVLRRNGTMDLAVRPDSLYGGRLPNYQRLDVRATRRKVTPNGEFRFFFELINLTNHDNVLGYDVFTVRDAQGVAHLVRDTESWFTILPSLGVSWSKRF